MGFFNRTPRPAPRPDRPDRNPTPPRESLLLRLEALAREHDEDAGELFEARMRAGLPRDDPRAKRMRHHEAMAERNAATVREAASLLRRFKAQAPFLPLDTLPESAPCPPASQES